MITRDDGKFLILCKYLTKNWEYIFLAMILALAVMVSCYWIAAPFFRSPYRVHHSGTGAQYSTYARNHLKFGYGATKLGVVVTYGWPDDDNLRFTPQYPFLFPFLVSLTFRILGVREWSAALVPLLSSLGTIVIVYFLTRRIAGRPTALLAALFAALVPMTAFYAASVMPEHTALFFAFLTLYLYFLWTRTPRRAYLLSLYGCSMFGTATNWVGYFVFPAILFHYIVFEHRRRRNWRFLVSLAIVPLLSFGLHLAQIYLVAGKGGLDALYGRFVNRSSFADTSRHAFTLVEYYQTIYSRFKGLFTPIVCSMVFVWLIYVVIKTVRQRKFSTDDGFICTLFVFGLGYHVLFPFTAFMHDFIQFQFLPFFAIAAAIGAKFICEKVPRQKVLVAVFMLLLLYFFGMQSLGTLRKLQWPGGGEDGYILGNYLNDAIDKQDYFLTSFHPGFPSLPYYIDRSWKVVTDLNALQADTFGSHYVLINTSPIPRDMKDYLVRNYALTSLFFGYGYTIFDLREEGNTVVTSPAIQHPLEINFDDQVKFLGYSLDEPVVVQREPPSWWERYLNPRADHLLDHRTFVHVTYYWQALAGMDQDYTFETHFCGYDGQLHCIPQVRQPFDGGFPTSLWGEGEIIREEWDVEIPARAAALQYEMWVNISDGDAGLPVRGEELEVVDPKGVRVGRIEVLPWQQYSGLTALPSVQYMANAMMGDNIRLVGYDFRKGKLTAYWESLGEEQDYGFRLELQSGDYIVSVPVLLPPSRLWKPGSYYVSETELSPYLLSSTYSLSFVVDSIDGIVQKTPLAVTFDTHVDPSVTILTEAGEPDNVRDGRMSERFSMAFELSERQDVELIVGWTGRTDPAETRIEVTVTNDVWVYKPKVLGILVVRRGDHTVSRLRIPKLLTVPGMNELWFESVDLKSSYVGWRRWLVTLVPDLAKFLTGSYHFPFFKGWADFDFVQVRTRTETLANHLQMAEIYVSRGMCQDVESVLDQMDRLETQPSDEQILALHTDICLRCGNAKSCQQMDIPDNLDLVLYDEDGSPKLHVLGYRVRQLPQPEGTQLSLYFEELDSLDRDYKIWLHGYVREEDITILPEGRRQYGHANFDHSPTPPTSEWEEGRIYIDLYIIRANPGAYDLLVGFYRRDGSRLCPEQKDTCAVHLGWHEIQ